MFGVRLEEFIVIAVVALIVIGPERLPKYAEQLARLVREGRRMALGLREQVRDEIGPEFDDVDWRKLDPRQYDPRRIVKDALKDTFDDEPKPRSSGARGSSGSARSSRTSSRASGSGGAAAASGGAAASRAAAPRGGRSGDADASTDAAEVTTPYDSDAT